MEHVKHCCVRVYVQCSVQSSCKEQCVREKVSWKENWIISTIGIESLLYHVRNMLACEIDRITTDFVRDNHYVERRAFRDSMGICLGILQKNLAVIWMFPRVHVGSIIAI
jgi:hypothetical protein